jgi:hypothetical protein
MAAARPSDATESKAPVVGLNTVLERALARLGVARASKEGIEQAGGG